MTSLATMVPHSTEPTAPAICHVSPALLAMRNAAERASVTMRAHVTAISTLQ